MAVLTTVVELEILATGLAGPVLSFLGMDVISNFFLKRFIKSISPEKENNI